MRPNAAVLAALFPRTPVACIALLHPAFDSSSSSAEAPLTPAPIRSVTTARTDSAGLADMRLPSAPPFLVRRQPAPAKACWPTTHRAPDCRNPALKVCDVGCRRRRFCLPLQVRDRCGNGVNTVPIERILQQARSSAGEHFPDTEGVGGSIPPVPTIFRGLSCESPMRYNAGSRCPAH